MQLRRWLFATAANRHRPPHGLDRGLALFITASTFGRTAHLATPERRDAFQALLQSSAQEAGIELDAWVLLPEHYHLIAVPDQPEGLPDWLNALHRRSALLWNEEDRQQGRQCWQNYWDRSLWTEGDVISRIHYIHRNPVKHGWVADPADWPWSSYREYQLLAEGDVQVRTQLARFRPPLKVPGDDF